MNVRSFKYSPILILLALSMVYVGAARADGKFFRTARVVDEPGIAAQRAVVVFRDNTETLVVQSDVEGSGDSFGWLLPLPAEPVSIAPCEPYALHAMNSVVQPHIAPPPDAIVVISIALAFITALLCCYHLQSEEEKEIPRFSVGRVVFLFVGLLVVATMLLPSLSRTMTLGHRQVELLQTTRAGLHDVAVIKGQSADAVAAWLTTNGFVCPESVKPVIKDYIADDWCFMAAKVSADAEDVGSGSAGGSDQSDTAGVDTVAEDAVTHHPLAVTFPATQAVYPMRLTGVDADPIQLDLYVISDKQAIARNLETWVCDSYASATYGVYLDDYRHSMPDVYSAQRTARSRIGMPTVSGLMWNGCVLTRLHGRLRQSQMQEDIDLTWQEPVPMRRTLHSRTGALCWATGAVTLVVIVLCVYFTIVASRNGWSWMEMNKRHLVHMIVPALLAGVICYAMLDTVAVKTGRHPVTRAHAVSGPHKQALYSLESDSPVSRFPDVYRRLLDEDAIEVNADSLESPGQYALDATSNGWELTILDHNYVPITVYISSNGVPEEYVEERSPKSLLPKRK